jgi:hypothetical protein
LSHTTSEMVDAALGFRGICRIKAFFDGVSECCADPAYRALKFTRDRHDTKDKSGDARVESNATIAYWRRRLTACGPSPVSAVTLAGRGCERIHGRVLKSLQPIAGASNPVVSGGANHGASFRMRARAGVRPRCPPLFLVQPAVDTLDIVTSDAAIAGSIHRRERILTVHTLHFVTKPFGTVIKRAFFLCHGEPPGLI